MLNTGSVVLLDHTRTINQIASLERRTTFGGRGESIDHPPKMHDDLANVVAGAAVYAQRNRITAERRENPPRVQLGYPGAKRHIAGRVVKNTSGQPSHSQICADIRRELEEGPQ